MASYNYTFSSGDTVTPTKLNDARTVSDIVNADIKSDAAIAGTKIAPNFGSQNVVTTGRIGVGTASPTERITIDNTGNSGTYVKLIDGNNTDVLLGIAGSGEAIYYTSNAKPLVFSTNATERLRIDASGNVAIGKTSAVAKLDVQGTATTDSVTNISQLNGVQINGNLASASSTGLGFQGGGGGGAGIVFSRDNSFGTTIAFSTNSQATTTAGALTERMRIDSSGLVGIGTTAPASSLHLAKDGGAVLRVTTNSGAGGGNSSILIGNQDSGGANTPCVIRSANADLMFGVGNSWSSEAGGTFTERMRIDSSGNVLTGGLQGAPGQADTSSTSGATLCLNTKRELRWSNTNASIYGGSGGADDNLYFHSGLAHIFRSSSTERMRIDSSGNVGIGASSPAYLLDANGTVNTSDAYRVDGVKVVGNRATGWEAPTGTATRTTFATTSVTLPLLAQRVKALIDDLTAHGLIGS